jgi:hypothetical protein
MRNLFRVGRRAQKFGKQHKTGKRRVREQNRLPRWPALPFIRRVASISSHADRPQSE